MVLAMTILVGLAAVSVVVYGLMGQKEIWDLDEGTGRLSRLKKKRDRLLRTLKDLELEKEAGTLTEDEFASLRRSYKAQAIAASKDLERVRRTRLRRLSKDARNVTLRAKQRVEDLVMSRRGTAPLILLAILLAFAGLAFAPAVQAAVVLNVTAYDAAASYPEARRAIDAGNMQQAFNDSIKVPFSGQELTIELINLGQGPRRGTVLNSWKVSTDSNGQFTLDTGLATLPQPAAFVASSAAAGARVFSPFFENTQASIVMYKTTSSPAGLISPVQVTYDYLPSGRDYKIRVQVMIGIVNNGEAMYIGKRETSGEREILRVPLPPNAELVDNSGPGPEGFALAPDRRAMIMDTPVEGIFGSFQSWKLTYDIPATQTFVQTYRFPFSLRAQSFSAWCFHQDMSLAAPQLVAGGPRPHPDAPVPEHKGRTYEQYATQVDLEANQPIQLVVTTDNAAIGQVSNRAVKWVGGFLLVFLLAILGGLIFGKGSPPPEALYGDLSGEEILDRIADLDGRFEQRKIKEADYRRYREALVNLAAEELAEVETARPTATEAAALSAVTLPSEVRDLLRRIDDVDGRSDAATVSERAHLLEALARALPREGKPAKAGRKK